ncbi:MAG: HlyD family efflux transporter periplasmic adaptor subunit, partial [Phycisphaeraceae bacterium]|nr:HlyD family efflux transporter periplasmic adaptor subunit [Phycisphaeraceae bacterium]
VPVACDLAVVDRGAMTVTVDEEGRTRLKERYVVSAPLAGYVARITLKPGDPVAAGRTVLASISATDPSLLDERALAQAEAKVRSAEAAVSRAEAELAGARTEEELARARFERVRAAAESGAATPQEVEDERLLLRTSEFARDAARFALDVAGYDLEQARAGLVQHTGAVRGDGAVFAVPSPISGKVLRVLHESAGVVVPGQPLVEVGSISDLEVEIDVLSDQAVRVRPGRRVSIERWGGAVPLAGVVRVVEPSGFMKVSALGVEEQRVNIIVDLIDAPETLGDNFRVEARIAVWETASAVRVPVGALFRGPDGGWAVYAVEDGRSRRRAVTVGERSDRFAEVLDGLQPGTTVVIFPSDRVADGVRVRAAER